VPGPRVAIDDLQERSVDRRERAFGVVDDMRERPADSGEPAKQHRARRARLDGPQQVFDRGVVGLRTVDDRGRVREEQRTVHGRGFVRMCSHDRRDLADRSACRSGEVTVENRAPAHVSMVPEHHDLHDHFEALRRDSADPGQGSFRHGLSSGT